MIRSRVREKLANDEPVMMFKVCYNDPEIVEMACVQGFDAIWICTEHKKIDSIILDSMIRACRLTGTDAIVRVKPSNHSDVLTLLEMGARGLMIPHVRSAKEAAQIVEYAKFKPLGKRGLDLIHADSGFGTIPLRQYQTEANANTTLMVQIEDKETIPHIDEIASVEGVDGLFVGPGDLSNDLGYGGELTHPSVAAVIDAVAESCRKRGKIAGIAAGKPDLARSYVEKGYRFFGGVSDFRFLMNGLRDSMESFEKAGFSFGE
jgi:4-hydroxy-2-oxoheptanedioate aldolase